MRVKENLSSITPSSKSNSNSTFKLQTGKVYAVIQNETTPSKEIFDANGGWDGLGSVLYLDYVSARNTDTVDLSKCRVAKPLFPNTKYFPLIGELIVVFDLPSYSTQVYQNNINTYYITPLNLWNNNHHNAQPTGDVIRLGKSFDENPDINPLYPFEGDYIAEGRFGNSIRFGSTTTYYNNVNPWSNSGNNGDPITIISNGHKYPKGSNVPYIEDINNDGSSIYLTSTQIIPLIVDRTTLNSLTSPIAVNKYNNPQAILNGNRIVINSNLDEVLIFAKTNIELYTNNIININSGDRIHLNSPRVFLGTNSDGSLPTEPILLGNQTILLFNSVFTEISKFCSVLSSSISPAEGSPLIDINTAAKALNVKMSDYLKKLKTIYSKTSFTI